MSVHFKPWETGGEYGAFYLLDLAGEGIGMHSHVNPEMRHSTRCLKGSCHIYGDGLDAVLKAGETLHFKSYRMHELVALEDGTELVNVFLNGKPASYEGLPLETLSGNVASNLMGPMEFNQGE